MWVLLKESYRTWPSEDSDCYQTSRQQAPCSAMCQCDGSQKTLLDVCSNKTAVPAALVSVHLWALKTRLLRGHKSHLRHDGNHAGAKALMWTRSEQCLQHNWRTLPESKESQDNSCRVNKLLDFSWTRMENEAWTLAGGKQNQAPTCTYTFEWERSIIRGWLFLLIYDGIMSYSCFSLCELEGVRYEV